MYLITNFGNSRGKEKLNVFTKKELASFGLFNSRILKEDSYIGLTMVEWGLVLMHTVNYIRKYSNQRQFRNSLAFPVFAKQLSRILPKSQAKKLKNMRVMLYIIYSLVMFINTLNQKPEKVEITDPIIKEEAMFSLCGLKPGTHYSEIVINNACNGQKSTMIDSCRHKTGKDKDDCDAEVIEINKQITEAQNYINNKQTGKLKTDFGKVRIPKNLKPVMFFKI